MFVAGIFDNSFHITWSYILKAILKVYCQNYIFVRIFVDESNYSKDTTQCSVYILNFIE